MTSKEKSDKKDKKPAKGGSLKERLKKQGLVLK